MTLQKRFPAVAIYITYIAMEWKPIDLHKYNISQTSTRYRLYLFYNNELVIQVDFAQILLNICDTSMIERVYV